MMAMIQLLGNKIHIGGEIMKNIYKSFALLCMGLAAVACVEEPFDDTVIDTTPGNEIVFTAKANVDDVKTKTEYGAVSDDGKTIAVHWKNGDKIQIASPNTLGTQNAEYRIGTANGENNSNAETLTKTGDVGLQWSSADTYEFYAMYPSPASTTAITDALILDENGAATMVGYIPSVQAEQSLVSTTDESGKVHYEYKPDMNYAYMAASASYTPTNNGDEAIGLNFEPLFTSLRFDISIPQIGNSTLDQRILIQKVCLTTTDQTKQLSGEFNYTYNSENQSSQETTFGSEDLTATVKFNQEVLLAANDVCSVTFLIPPTSNWVSTETDSDLKLTVTYKNGATIYEKTAQISADIKSTKMHHFKNVQLPSIDDISGDSWIEHLDPTTPITQLSLAVAGNVFANTTYEGVQDYTSQQGVLYNDLWKLGVRAFELTTRSSRANHRAVPDWGLRDEHFVCSEVLLETSPTFGDAFETLVGNFVTTNEFLVLICTYQSITDGYDPDRFVTDLLTYFDWFCNNNDYGITKNSFIRINSQTTVGDLVNRIGVIIRPGDDDRYETNSVTANIKLNAKGGDNNSWSEHVVLVQDWGTAFDVWDRRVEVNGVSPAREATFDNKYVYDMAGKLSGTKRPQVEDRLFAQSNNKSTAPNFTSFSDVQTIEFNSVHTITPANTDEAAGTAYVQEWTRVVPATLDNDPIYAGYCGRSGFLSYSERSPYLWVRWPESITEKKKAIDNLFLRSVSRDDRDKYNLFINVLSGYYVTHSVKTGLLPFDNALDSGFYDQDNLRQGLTGQGKGGDYKSLAKDLNEYVYKILAGESALTINNTLDPGPWGLVVIDHIKSDPEDYSYKLLNLIMMNNFKEHMIQPSRLYNATYANGGEAISFE